MNTLLNRLFPTTIGADKADLWPTGHTVRASALHSIQVAVELSAGVKAIQSIVRAKFAASASLVADRRLPAANRLELRLQRIT